MSRLRQTGKSTNTNTVKGSRITGTSFGMGRRPDNFPGSRSPNVPNKFSTPEKKLGSTKKFNTFKKQAEFDPKQYMVPECSLRDIQIYKQVFDFLDEDHDGNLTPLDLRKCIREYGGYNPGRKFVYVAMSVFDSDDGGQIDFTQFVKLMTTKPYERDTEDDLLRVFESVDEDGKGYIDESDLQKLAAQMQQQVSIQQIKEAILQAAPQGNGRINFKDFVKFSRRKQYE